MPDTDKKLSILIEFLTREVGPEKAADILARVQAQTGGLTGAQVEGAAAADKLGESTEETGKGFDHMSLRSRDLRFALAPLLSQTVPGLSRVLSTVLVQGLNAATAATMGAGIAAFALLKHFHDLSEAAKKARTALGETASAAAGLNWDAVIEGIDNTREALAKYTAAMGDAAKGPDAFITKLDKGIEKIKAQNKALLDNLAIQEQVDILEAEKLKEHAKTPEEKAAADTELARRKDHYEQLKAMNHAALDESILAEQEHQRKLAEIELGKRDAAAKTAAAALRQPAEENKRVDAALEDAKLRCKTAVAEATEAAELLRTKTKEGVAASREIIEAAATAKFMAEQADLEVELAEDEKERADLAKKVAVENVAARQSEAVAVRKQIAELDVVIDKTKRLLEIKRKAEEESAPAREKLDRLKFGGPPPEAKPTAAQAQRDALARANREYWSKPAPPRTTEEANRHAEERAAGEARNQAIREANRLSTATGLTADAAINLLARNWGGVKSSWDKLLALAKAQDRDIQDMKAREVNRR